MAPRLSKENCISLLLLHSKIQSIRRSQQKIFRALIHRKNKTKHQLSIQYFVSLPCIVALVNKSVLNWNEENVEQTSAAMNYSCE